MVVWQHRGPKYWGIFVGKVGGKKGRGRTVERTSKTKFFVLFPSQFYRLTNPKATITEI